MPMVTGVRKGPQEVQILANFFGKPSSLDHLDCETRKGDATHHHMTDLNRLIRTRIVWAALFREYFAAGEKRFRGAFYRADATDREPGKAGII